MNAIADKPLAVPAESQTPAPPSRLARGLRRAWRPVAALVVVVGAGVTASWWFTEGRYIQSTDNAYVQGDIAVLEPAHRGRRGGDQGHRQPACACRRSVDRAGSDRLAGPPRAGHRGRGRGRRRGADGAAAGDAAAGDDRCGGGRHRSGAGRAGADQRGREALRVAGGRRLGLAAGQRPGDRRLSQGRCGRGRGAGAEGGSRRQQLDVLGAQVVQAQARQQNADCGGERWRRTTSPTP